MGSVYPLVVDAEGLALTEVGVVVVNTPAYRWVEAMIGAGEDQSDNLQIVYLMAHEQVHFLHAISTHTGHMASVARRAAWENFVTTLREELHGNTASGSSETWLYQFFISSIDNIYEVMTSGKGSGPNELSTLDILESSAALEGIRFAYRVETAKDYRRIRDALHDCSGEHGEYARAFEWLASRLGDELAFRLLAPITFLSLNPDKIQSPAERFINLSKCVADGGGLAEFRDSPERLDDMLIGPLLELCGWRHEPLFPLVCHAEPIAKSTTAAGRTCNCLLKTIDLKQALSTFARPSVELRRLDVDGYRLFLPTLIVFQGREAEVEGPAAAFPSQQTREVVDLACYEATIYGLAEGFISHRVGVRPYNACPHIRCPHHQVGLCSRFYWSPPREASFEECLFPKWFSEIFEDQVPTITLARWLAVHPASELPEWLGLYRAEE